MYLTDCTLQRWLRPMGVLHPGQGNDVLSLSISGAPEDAHTTALCANIVPLGLRACDAPFLALIVGTRERLAAVPSFSTSIL